MKNNVSRGLSARTNLFFYLCWNYVMSDYRIEKDLLGEMEVPAGVYWKIHTQRAVSNFPISKTKVNS